MRDHDLMGMADPGGVSLGFVVPLFTDGRSNAPLVQRIVEGSVDGFEPYEVPEALMMPGFVAEGHAPLRVGDAALHAFCFGKGDIAIVRNLDDEEALAERIGDAALTDRPLLAMELASFVGRDDLRVDLGRRVYEHLRKSSSQSAERWRDLSVLTSDLRRRLAGRGELRANLLSETVVASVDEEVVVLRGVGGEVGPEMRSILRKEALAALAQLGPLYPAGARWTVRVRQAGGGKLRPDSEAAVLLASSGARGLLGRHVWPADPDVELFSQNGSEFTRRVEETEVPLFVVYDAKEPDVMRRAIGDWTVRDMHGIALGRPPARDVREDSAAEPWPATFIARPGIRSVSGSDRNAIQGIQLAVAAELDRGATDLRAPGRRSVLLRANGAGPDPQGDAWASLYDRAWTMGLDPRRSLRLPGLVGPGAGTRSPEPGWVEGLLFEGSLPVIGDRVAAVMTATRTTAAALVDVAPRAEGDAGLRRAVVRLAERQGWAVRDADFRDLAAPLTLVGRTAIPVEFEMTKMPGERGHGSPFDIDLRTIEGVALSGSAGPGAILAALRSHRTLLVGLRDLVTFPAHDSTVLSLVGNQLRRQVTGLPARSRTQYLAMVVAQAFIGGIVRSRRAAQVEFALHDLALGDRVHLVLSNVRQVDGGVLAHLRLLDDALAPPGGPAAREVGRFGILVQPHQVQLLDVDGVVERNVDLML